jgi:hypothetical protein
MDDSLFAEVARHAELNSFTDILRRYREALARLESWGIRISPHSRLRAYERRLRSLGADYVPIPEDIALQIMFDLREIDEITEIVEHFRVAPLPAAIAKLSKIVSGVEHPDEEPQSTARDTQYELFLHTMFQRSPIKSKLGEPDLILTWKGVRFALEAKRPKSDNSFDDNLRKAANQLEQRSTPGIVAISLDQVLRPRGNHLRVPRPELMAEFPATLIEQFIAAHNMVIDKRTHGKNVAAILFTARIPAQVESTGHASLATGIHIHPLVGARSSESARQLLVAMVRSSQPLDLSTFGDVGRNEQCPCKSGCKFKDCHGAAGRYH